ncbi:hypothetical protein O6H91_18G063200 [Diphasiastrum complanatum]|uniref:Uncharacterized protein n=1 Tax=Diphasiastrum complanatum TaxID=34168 RepID=A0ACC2B259_DIPCM|nr:hypothetical protein O6H91_18G063200 [Diphasiastrum complanatum]
MVDIRRSESLFQEQEEPSTKTSKNPIVRFQSFSFLGKSKQKKAPVEIGNAHAPGDPIDPEQSRHSPLAESGDGISYSLESTSLIEPEVFANVRDTSRSCRVTVVILQAKDLKKHMLGTYVKDPYFKIRIEDISFKTSQVKSSIDKDGVLQVNQRFMFNVKDSKTAELHVEVFERGMLGSEVSLGACLELHIAKLLEQNLDEKDERAKWYELFLKDGKKKMPGKVMMDIVAYIAEPEQTINVFVGTWNVGNTRPPADLSSWLPTNSFYEIVAIGAQECEYQPEASFSECGKDWLHSLRSQLGPRYKILKATSRGQMRLAVFVRDNEEKAICEVYKDSEATGVGHVMANKGGLCIAFKFWDTRLCFVNSHFAAHVGQCSARNGNYREIVGQLRVGIPGMDILSQFHHVFWLGDLNYRLDFGGIEGKSTTPPKEPWLNVVKMIKAGNLKELLQYDELAKEIKASRVLYKFEEGEITFAPTFKMQKGSLNTYSEKRLPAWCDRILWRSVEDCNVKLLSYNSSPAIMTSDHKPVAATFSLVTYSLPSFTTLGLATENDQRWHIRFTSLQAKQLRASDIGGSSDPYVLFMGPNVIREFRTKVKHKTLTPVWDPQKDLPTLVLKPFPLQRLEKEYLMVRVLDFDYTSADDSLGFTVIPISLAVAAFRKGPQETAYFSVELLRHGLPTGTLEGEMILTREKSFAKRRVDFANKLVKKTIAARNSFKNVILLKEYGCG